MVFGSGFLRMITADVMQNVESELYLFIFFLHKNQSNTLISMHNLRVSNACFRKGWGLGLGPRAVALGWGFGLGPRAGA